MHRILVTGSTGNIGRHVVKQLRAMGAWVRAMTRDPEAAGLPAHVDVVRGEVFIDVGGTPFVPGAGIPRQP